MATDGEHEHPQAAPGKRGVGHASEIDVESREVIWKGEEAEWDYIVSDKKPDLKSVNYE